MGKPLSSPKTSDVDPTRNGHIQVGQLCELWSSAGSPVSPEPITAVHAQGTIGGIGSEIRGNLGTLIGDAFQPTPEEWENISKLPQGPSGKLNVEELPQR